MAPAVSKYVDARFERLAEENTVLRRDIDRLTESVAELKAELQGMQFVVSENVERREVAETSMADLTVKYSDLMTYMMFGLCTRPLLKGRGKQPLL